MRTRGCVQYILDDFEVGDSDFDGFAAGLKLNRIPACVWDKGGSDALLAVVVCSREPE